MALFLKTARKINGDEKTIFTEEYHAFSVLVNSLLKPFYSISAPQMYTPRFRRPSLAAKKFTYQLKVSQPFFSALWWGKESHFFIAAKKSSAFSSEWERVFSGRASQIQRVFISRSAPACYSRGITGSCDPAHLNN
jgi:hypothetical protein